MLDNLLIKSMNLPQGKLAEFCPCIYNCEKQNVDSNCFYEKFLHCREVERLGLADKLPDEDKQNRKVYKG